MVDEYLMNARDCTSQMPLIDRKVFRFSILNSIIPSMSEPIIWISWSPWTPFSMVYMPTALSLFLLPAIGLRNLKAVFGSR